MSIRTARSDHAFDGNIEEVRPPGREGALERWPQIGGAFDPFGLHAHRLRGWRDLDPRTLDIEPGRIGSAGVPRPAHALDADLQYAIARVVEHDEHHRAQLEVGRGP